MRGSAEEPLIGWLSGYLLQHLARTEAVMASRQRLSLDPKRRA